LSSLLFAGLLANKLDGHDFARLLQLILSRSVEWQEHLAEVLGLVRDSRSRGSSSPRWAPATATFAARHGLREFDLGLIPRADPARIFKPATKPEPRQPLHQLVIAELLSAAKICRSLGKRSSRHRRLT
jgi:hypothetical protein